MEWLTNHFTKERKLHGREMLVLRIEVWLTLMGLALYGLVVLAVLLFLAIRFGF